MGLSFPSTPVLSQGIDINNYYLKLFTSSTPELVSWTGALAVTAKIPNLQIGEVATLERNGLGVTSHAS